MNPLLCSAERSVLWEADGRSFGRDIPRVNGNEKLMAAHLVERFPVLMEMRS